MSRPLVCACIDFKGRTYFKGKVTARSFVKRAYILKRTTHLEFNQIIRIKHFTQGRQARRGNRPELLWTSHYSNYPRRLLLINGRFYLLLFNLAFIQSAPGAIRVVHRSYFSPFVTGLIESEVSGCVLAARGSVYTFNSGAFHRAQNVIESHRILRRP